MASGPRRGEITVLLVVNRGFIPSPYPSPGRSWVQKLVSCVLVVASPLSVEVGELAVFGLAWGGAPPTHYPIIFISKKSSTYLEKHVKNCKYIQNIGGGGSKQSSDLKKYEEYIVGNHPHEAMLGTTLIRPGLQSKLSSLTVCNSKNGMGFGPSWALMRPCWETILESSWGSLGPSWDYLVAFLGLS